VLAVPVTGVEAGMTVVAQEKLVEAGIVLPDGTEEHCCVPLVEAVRKTCSETGESSVRTN